MLKRKVGNIRESIIFELQAIKIELRERENKWILYSSYNFLDLGVDLTTTM